MNIIIYYYLLIFIYLNKSDTNFSVITCDLIKMLNSQGKNASVGRVLLKHVQMGGIFKAILKSNKWAI